MNRKKTIKLTENDSFGQVNDSHGITEVMMTEETMKNFWGKGIAPRTQYLGFSFF